MNPVARERELVQYASRLRNDFQFFMDQVWANRGYDKFAPMGAVEKDILVFANGKIVGVSKFRGVLAPRALGKTHLVTCGLSAYRLFRDPNRKVVITSKSHTEAKKTVSLIREWIEYVPFLQHLRPKKDKWDNRDMFMVGPAAPHRQASVTALGIEGQLAGGRAHTIIPDDVETGSNTTTLDAREKLDHSVVEFKNMLYGELPTDTGLELLLDPPEIVYIGTYHHEESLYLKLAERGYQFRTYPITVPEPGETFLGLAPLIEQMVDRGVKPGTPTMPHRFDAKNIAERRSEGRRNWALQHQLVSKMSDGDQYPLRLEDLIVTTVDNRKAPTSVVWGQRSAVGSTKLDIPSRGFGSDCFYGPAMIDPAWMDYQGCKMWIDPSGRGEDKTGVAIIAMLNGILWCKALLGLPGGYGPEALALLAKTARDYLVDEIYIEDNFGRGMFRTLLEPVVEDHFLTAGKSPMHPKGWSATITDRNATGQKEARIIDTLAPVMGQHRLVVDTRVAENQDFQLQLTRITRQRGALKHEDELDALAGCVKEWQDAMNLDPEKNKLSLKERRLQQAIDDALRGFGQLVPEPNWIVPVN